MDADHRLVVACGLQHVEKLLVVHFQPVVGHEDLERGMPGLHQRRHFLRKYFLTRVGEDHVKRIIDHGASLGELVIILDHGLQRHADVLRGERDHRRGAACAAAVVALSNVVGVHFAGGRELLDVAVRVDAAGQHVFAACVDLLLSLVEPSAMAAILSPRMPTSALKLSVAVATVPPRITRSKGVMRYSLLVIRDGAQRRDRDP